jgi:hypothetical protein
MTDSIFDLVLNEYPRKEARAPGRKAVLKALKTIQKEDGSCLLEAIESLLRAVVAFRKHWEYLISSGQKEKKFIPMAATFFNQERYLDAALWEQAPQEKSKLPPEDWANANWKPILEAYRIDWGTVMYWGDDWNATWNNLPSAVRADLMHNWKTDQ